MGSIHHLKAQRSHLHAVVQTMDNYAPLDSKEGKLYVKALVRLVQISMQIEELEKERAAVQKRLK